MKSISEKDKQVILRKEVENILSKTLTEFEEYIGENNGEMIGYEEILYGELVYIQNKWEDIIAEK